MEDAAPESIEASQEKRREVPLWVVRSTRCQYSPGTSKASQADWLLWTEARVSSSRLRLAVCVAACADHLIFMYTMYMYCTSTL